MDGTLMYVALPTKAFFYYLPSLMNLVEFWTAKSKIIDVDLLFLMSSRFAKGRRCGNIFDNSWSQPAQWNLNKIEKTFNGTFYG